MEYNHMFNDFFIFFQIKQILNDVGLLDQDDTFALNLSGGQKRKLSVAIALIGDPKVLSLLLDFHFFLYHFLFPRS